MNLKRLLSVLLAALCIGIALPEQTAALSPDDDPEIAAMLERQEDALAVWFALEEYKQDEAVQGAFTLAGSYIDDEQIYVVQVQDLASRDYLDARFQADGLFAYRFEIAELTDAFLEEMLVELTDQEPGIRVSWVDTIAKVMVIEVTEDNPREPGTETVLANGAPLRVERYRGDWEDQSKSLEPIRLQQAIWDLKLEAKQRSARFGEMLLMAE